MNNLKQISAQEKRQIVNLAGNWKFSIGDSPEWASPVYNDNNWEEIKVPSAWESQGFYSYNGYAWYRKSFFLSQAYKDKFLILELGYIDDVDEVYLNGILIGYSGSFPPHFSSAYSAKRVYHIPADIIRPNNDNVIAIRVFDSYREGGILKGNTRLLELLDPIPLDINLQGMWKFRTGDDLKWANTAGDDPGWFNIMVPGYWENMGFKDYDGYAWYCKTFKAGKELAAKSMLLVLGKIDDIDQAYINGFLVGSTGIFHSDPNKIRFDSEWMKLRVYEIPANILRYQSENIITVRVFDGQQGGGIYEGPVGLISAEKYDRYNQNRK